MTVYIKNEHQLSEDFSQMSEPIDIFKFQSKDIKMSYPLQTKYVRITSQISQQF